MFFNIYDFFGCGLTSKWCLFSNSPSQKTYKYNKISYYPIWPRPPAGGVVANINLQPGMALGSFCRNPHENPFTQSWDTCGVTQTDREKTYSAALHSPIQVVISSPSKIDRAYQSTMSVCLSVCLSPPFFWERLKSNQVALKGSSFLKWSKTP